MVFWALFFVVLFGGMLSLRRTLGRKEGFAEGRFEVVRCAACGYALRGLDLARCPECGALRGFCVPLTDLVLTEDELRAARARKECARAMRSGEAAEEEEA